MQVPWDLEYSVIKRLLALRKQGKVGIILAECGEYYIAYDEFDPWGSKVHYSIPELLALVISLEQPELRKDMAKAGVLWRNEMQRRSS